MTALLLTLAMSLPFIALAVGCLLWIHRSRTPLLARYQVLRVLFCILAICASVCFVAVECDNNRSTIAVPLILCVNAVLAGIEMQKRRRRLNQK